MPFLGSRLDYGNIVYDRPDNEEFINKLEVQYDAALTINRVITNTWHKKLYK